MKIIAADDEYLALEMLKDAISLAAPDAEVFAFKKPSALLEFAEHTSCDVAFLDIQMCGKGGIELAKILKEKNNAVNIIFVTGYSDYTGDAMSLHASGYIMKPVTAEKIRKELCDLRYPPKPDACLTIQCFGNFEAFTPTGEIVKFDRTKSKEILAYLVYKQGSSCTIRELSALLFEDAEYDEKQRSYTQQLISTLCRNLKAVGAENAVKKSFNSISLNTAFVDCDYYKFNNGDENALRRYKGEFMAQYSWAEFVTGYLNSSVSKTP